MHTSLEHLPANLIYVKLKRKKYVSESQQFIWKDPWLNSSFSGPGTLN